MPNSTPQPEYVDATKLNDFLQCLRYGYWRHERGLVTTTPQLPLAYGIGIHAGVAAFYRGGDTRDMAAAFDAEWVKHSKGEEDTKRNPLQALKTLTAYADYYADDLTKWKVLGVEMPGLVPLTPTFVWTMILDLLVDSAGRILPIDHKTASFINQGFWAAMHPNHQFTGYMNGVREVSGHKVNMLMVNAIPVTKGQPKFDENMRQITSRHPIELQRWATEILSFWEHTVLACRKTGVWPQNPDRCQRWWGGCPYHYLCTTVSTDFMKEDPSRELYEVEVWDPLSKIKEVQSHG